MSGMIPERLLTKYDIDYAALVQLADNGSLDRLLQMCKLQIHEDAFPVLTLGEVFGRRLPFINPALFGLERDESALLVRDPGIMKPGLYFSFRIDCPAWLDDETQIALYPVKEPFSDGYIFHWYPQSASLEAVTYDESQRKLAPQPKVLFEGRAAAHIMRASFTLLNRPQFYLWADMSDPEVILDIADSLHKPLNTFVRGLSGQTFYFISQGKMDRITF